MTFSNSTNTIQKMQQTRILIHPNQFTGVSSNHSEMPAKRHTIGWSSLSKLKKKKAHDRILILTRDVDADQHGGKRPEDAPDHRDVAKEASTEERLVDGL